jgi:hypothetical protein
VRISALVSILIGIGIAAPAAVGDISPKPTILFRLSLPKSLSVTSGVLLQCASADCRDAAPLKAFGPQGFDCEGMVCSGEAYGFAQFGALEIKLSDGRQLRSNVFRIAAFHAKFRVSLGGAGLLATPLK